MTILAVRQYRMERSVLRSSRGEHADRSNDAQETWTGRESSRHLGQERPARCGTALSSESEENPSIIVVFNAVSEFNPQPAPETRTRRQLARQAWQNSSPPRSLSSFSVISFALAPFVVTFPLRSLHSVLSTSATGTGKFKMVKLNRPPLPGVNFPLPVYKGKNLVDIEKEYLRASFLSS